MRTVGRRAAVLLGATTVLAAANARASGFELPDNGDLAMGRAGAFTARASDPTALMHNVAGIMGLPGVQVSIGANFSLLDHCFARYGEYDGGWNGAAISTDGTIFANSHYADGGVPYPRVCNDAGVFIAPQVLATWRINEHFAVGAGVYGPNSIGRQHFADQVQALFRDGRPAGLAPSPIRHMMLSENLLILHPTIAFAGAPFRWLRIGVALQPSFASYEFTTVANVSPSSAQSPDNDTLTKAQASGFFLAYNLGAQVIAPRYITGGIHVHVNPETATLSGTGEATAGFYRTPAPMPSQFTVARLSAGLASQVRVGVRFALPRGADSNPLADNYDPMRDEWFDLEVDGIYERSSAFRSLVLQNSGQINALGVTATVPSATVPHHWSDVFGVRAGGDVNVLPGLLTLRAGAAYETGAQTDTMTAHIDVPAYYTLSLHAGATLRINVGGRKIEIHGAYAHHFMGGIDAGDGALSVVGMNGPITGADCNGSSGPGVCHANQGVFTASADAVHAGVTARF